MRAKYTDFENVQESNDLFTRIQQSAQSVRPAHHQEQGPAGFGSPGFGQRGDTSFHSYAQDQLAHQTTPAGFGSPDFGQRVAEQPAVHYIRRNRRNGAVNPSSFVQVVGIASSSNVGPEELKVPIPAGVGDDKDVVMDTAGQVFSGWSKPQVNSSIINSDHDEDGDENGEVYCSSEHHSMNIDMTDLGEISSASGGPVLLVRLNFLIMFAVLVWFSLVVVETVRPAWFSANRNKYTRSCAILTFMVLLICGLGWFHWISRNSSHPDRLTQKKFRMGICVAFFTFIAFVLEVSVVAGYGIDSDAYLNCHGVVLILIGTTMGMIFATNLG